MYIMSIKWQSFIWYYNFLKENKKKHIYAFKKNEMLVLVVCSLGCVALHVCVLCPLDDCDDFVDALLNKKKCNGSATSDMLYIILPFCFISIIFCINNNNI